MGMTEIEFLGKPIISDISFNNIGPEGMVYLETPFKQMKSIKILCMINYILDLSENPLAAKEPKLLSNSLIEMKDLHTLYLRKIQLSHQGAMFMSQAFDQLKNLQHLCKF